MKLKCPHCGEVAANMFAITPEVEESPFLIVQAARQLSEAARQLVDNLESMDLLSR